MTLKKTNLHKNSALGFPINLISDFVTRIIELTAKSASKQGTYYRKNKNIDLLTILTRFGSKAAKP